MATPTMHCPRCRTGLAYEEVEGRRRAACPTCGGIASTIAVLRQTSPKPAFRAFWGAVMQASGPSHLPCPACARPMLAVQCQTQGEAVTVDRCAPCQIVWFDPEERARLLGRAQDRRAAQAQAEAARIATLSAQAQGAIAGLEAETRTRAAEGAALRAGLDRLSEPVKPRWHRGHGDLHGALWVLDAFGVSER